VSVEGVDWDEIDGERSDAAGADGMDRHEAKFRLGMEPFEERDVPVRGWGAVALLAVVLLLAGVGIGYGLSEMGVW
jgi:hypothetical protein